MYLIDTLPGYIELGHLNEKGVSEIQFDVSAWKALYPTGVFSITYTRPGEITVYPVDEADLSVATVGLITTLTWTVSDAVTAISGSGSAVIQCAVGSTIVKKSDMVQTIISTGHDASEEPPEPLADYIAKWGAVDVVVNALESGASPTGSVTQDEDGTHFVFGIPAPGIPT